MAGMKKVKFIGAVDFKDGTHLLALDALDIGDSYRIVFRWADSLEVPDQGEMPGRYVDLPKDQFEAGPEPDGQPSIVSLKPLNLNTTYEEVFSDA